MTRSHAFSRASRQLRLFTSSFDWFTGLASLLAEALFLVFSRQRTPGKERLLTGNGLARVITLLLVLRDSIKNCSIQFEQMLMDRRVLCRKRRL